MTFISGDLLQTASRIALVVQVTSGGLTFIRTPEGIVQLLSEDPWVLAGHPQREWPYILLPSRIRNVTSVEKIGLTENQPLGEIHDWILQDGFKSGGALYLRKGVVGVNDHILLNNSASVRIPPSFASFEERTKKPEPIEKPNPFGFLGDD